MAHHRTSFVLLSLSLAAIACTGNSPLQVSPNGSSGGSSATADAAAPAPGTPTGADELPGALVTRDIEGRVRNVTGALAAGSEPGSVASTFLEQHWTLLGLTDSEVVSHGSGAGKTGPVPVLYDPSTKKYKFRLYRYEQRSSGIPVVGAGVDLLVRDQQPYILVRAGSSTRDLTGFVPTLAGQGIDYAAAKAHLSSKSRAGFVPSARSGLGPQADIETDPEPVIWAGNDASRSKPRLATTYVARTVNPQGRVDKLRVVADMETGQILYKESLIVFENVTGTVRGRATSNADGIDCSTAVAMPLPNLWMSGMPGYVRALTDANGSYTLAFPGTAPATVTSGLAGQIFNVTDFDPTRTSSLSASVVPPQTHDFLHNASEDLNVHAQVNAYVHSQRIHDWVLAHHPDFPQFSYETDLNVVVNHTDPTYCPGNAWYDGRERSFNYCVAGSGYANSAIGSIIYHEVAHYAVDAGGSGQGPYGEGMGDALAALVSDAPGLGIGFYAGDCTNPDRTVENECAYSVENCSTCGYEAHLCGQMLAGAIWGVRTALHDAYPDTYKDLVASLALSSILLHRGSTITPQVVADFLTLDDDDGDLNNGTPHRTEICAGFEAHGLACPAVLHGLDVTPTDVPTTWGKSGGPFLPASFAYTLHNYGPGSLDYDFMPVVPWLTVNTLPGTLAEGASASVVVSINQQANALANGSYSGSLVFINKTAHLEDTLRYVNMVVDPNHLVYWWPFDTDPGWTRGGAWEFGKPQGQSTDPVAAHTGSNVLGTNLAGYWNSAPEGWVTTNAIDCTHLTGVHLKFWRWLGADVVDHAKLAASNDGANWTTVWQNTGFLVDSAWTRQDFDLSSIADGKKLYLRWSIGPVDVGQGVISGGWNIDDVEIWGIGDAVAPRACTRDADCSDGVYCNGTEACRSGVCQFGMPPCDDSITCTVDSCVESTRSCTHTANHGRCDNGSYCDGAETCNPTTGCVAGVRACDDGINCTNDTCDEATKSCGHEPLNAICDDALYCNGVETCDAIRGCVIGAPPCSGTCDETNDRCSLSPPTIVGGVTATPNPVVATTTSLAVVATDDGGEVNLTYTWATTGTPPAPVTFSANGTNAAKNVVATFSKAGSYGLQVTVKDRDNMTAIGAVTVMVNQTLTSIAVSPASATVAVSGTQQFTATARDQFGANLTTQPSFSWSVNGGGTMGAAGLFTAGATAGGPYTVTATSSGVSGSASVTVTSSPAAIYQIDCGSTSAVAPFAADQYVSGGTRRAVTNTITISGITNPAPMAVYQSERYGASTYTLPNLTPGGQYTVRLHFAELYQTAAGRRVFNVLINGVTALSSFDIYAAAGAAYKAVVRELPATANTSGQVVIAFQNKTDNATIEGIELLAAGVPPTIATPAAASPSPVTGSSTTLSVLGGDDGGEPSLTYTWATTGTPPAAVTFSANGTNAAKSTTATFSKAGTYALQVTVSDQTGLTATSSVSVTVNQTLTAIVVSPASATVATSGTQQFTATARDQFGTDLTTQPSFSWSVSGGGSISGSGSFTAGATAGGPFTVTAASGTVRGTATVTVGSSPTAVYRINCGSTTAVSPFAADQYGSGGTTRTVTNSITITGVTNPAPAAVYQSERYGASTYTFPNLTAGTAYTVRLHFAELYQTAAGRRVFNVAINGTTVLTSFDIYAAAGGNYRALVREFTSNADASGKIAIAFQNQTDNATIGGIEIIRN